MSLYNLPNATEGIDQFLVETSAEIPSLFPMLLVFVFFVVFLGGILRQKSREVRADYAAWAVIASIASLLVALIASTQTGIIRLDILIINLVVTIFAGVWLFMDRKPSEV